MASSKSASPQFEDPNIGVSIMVATVSTIRLGRVEGPPGWWRFKPVPEGTYALILPVEEDERTILRGARAGEDGLLYELDADDRSSRESSLKMYLEAPRDYYVWWTTDEGLYAQALEEPNVVREQGQRIAVEQYHWLEHAPLLELLERLDQGEDFHARTEVRHTICHHLLHRHLLHEDRRSPIFDVTPRPLRALYSAELIEWFLCKSTLAAGEDMATLQHAAAMIQAADKGLTDAYLEEKAASLFSRGEKWGEEWKVFEKFREYTWRCAATGIDQPIFRQSIAMHEGPSDSPQGGTPDAADGGVPAAPEGLWLRFALEIRETSAQVRNGPAVHPYLQGVNGPSRGFTREGSTLDPAQQELLVEYFSAYRFGAQLRNCHLDDATGFAPSDAYRTRMTVRLADWCDSKAHLLADARDLLEREARCDRLVLAIARCHSDDPDLLERYVHAAAFCEAPWWQGLSEAEFAEPARRQPYGNEVATEWPFWKRFKVWLKPLAEGAKGAGKISKMLKERLAVYKLSAKLANAMLDPVARLELALEGLDIDGTRHRLPFGNAVIQLAPTDAEGTVRIALTNAQRRPGAPQEVTLRFMKQAGGAAAGQSPLEPASVSGKFKVLLPADTATLKDTQRFTAPFAALADAVNLAIALTTVCGEAGAKDKALATFDLSKSVVGLVSSFPAALIALDPKREASPAVQRLTGAAKMLDGTAKALSHADNAIKIYKGLEVLLRDESPAALDARQGRTIRVRMQRVNDVANVVVALGSAIELTGAALQAEGIASVLGLSSTLAAGFSTTPWGLAVCVGGAVIVAGSALVFELAQPWETRLMQLEKEIAQACNRQVAQRRFRSALSLDALRAEIGKAW